jgi:hypothetical protein
VPWDHIRPIHGHPMQADIDCSNLQFPAKFIVAGDFDSDGLTELAVAPDATGSRGNDLWVMKFNVAAGSWQHMAPIPTHPMDADIDCSGRQFPAKFAVVADFDGDGRAELVIAPVASGSRGNDLWVMKYVGTFPQGMWQQWRRFQTTRWTLTLTAAGTNFRRSSLWLVISMAMDAPS